MTFTELKTISLQIQDMNRSQVDTRTPRVVAIDGTGFELDVETSSQGVVDTVVSQTIKRQDITLTLVFMDNDTKSARAQEADFRNWLTAFADTSQYRIVLTMQDGGNNPEGDGYRTLQLTTHLKSLTISAMEAGVVEDDLTLTAMSPWFVRRMSTMELTSTADPENIKRFAYPLPYVYPGSAVSGTDAIENDFFEEVPITVTLKAVTDLEGPITMSLTHDVNGEQVIYSSVTINRTLLAGHTLLLDGETLQVLDIPASGESEDAFIDVDQSGRSFLYAIQGVSNFALAAQSGQWTATVEWSDYIL